MTRAYKIGKCVRCCKERNMEGRGLCHACYTTVHRNGELKNYPVRYRCRIPSNADPLIRWIFTEIYAQNRTVEQVSFTSGVSHSLQKWRYHSNPFLQNFRAVVEALGYEIKLVAKEPVDASNENQG